jgi:hypothetical protein
VFSGDISEWVWGPGGHRARGDLERERSQAALTTLLSDPDQRVIPAVLDALAKVGATNAAAELTARLTTDDAVVRGAAARGLATIKAPNATAALTEAFKTSQRDGLYVARTAILDALTALDPAAAKAVLLTALSDRDWAVRVRAAENLKKVDNAADVSSMRPAPPPSVYTPDTSRAAMPAIFDTTVSAIVVRPSDVVCAPADSCFSGLVSVLVTVGSSD